MPMPKELDGFALVIVLLLGWVAETGSQRDLIGWSQQTRLTDSPNGHLYPNANPQQGACINGTIIKWLTLSSVTACELMCGHTPGCRWYAYCASHLDISLPVEHALMMQYCNDVRDILGLEPMSAFGQKRDKCVLYSKCLRVSVNVNGTVPYTGFHIYQYAPHGVITGRNAHFPDQLPDKLKTRNVPDSLHPNLRFWFTPEQLDQEGRKDGDRVQVWRNIANICYRGHPEYMMDPHNYSSLLGNCNPSLQDRFIRDGWPQDYGEVTNFVQTIGNSQKEILYQHNPAQMPQYRTNMIRGHSALRFRRKNTDGSKGKFMYMYTVLGDKQGFEVLVPCKTHTKRKNNVASPLISARLV